MKKIFLLFILILSSFIQNVSAQSGGWGYVASTNFYPQFDLTSLESTMSVSIRNTDSGLITEQNLYKASFLDGMTNTIYYKNEFKLNEEIIYYDNRINWKGICTDGIIKNCNGSKQNQTPYIYNPVEHGTGVIIVVQTEFVRTGLNVFPKNVVLANQNPKDQGLSINTRTKIVAPDCYSESDYNWVYKTGISDSKWKLINNQSLQGSHILEATIEDIYGDNEIDYTSTTLIALAYNTLIENNNEFERVVEYSTTIVLSNKALAPYISLVKEDSPGCVGENTGVVTLKLDRKPYPKEVITFYDAAYNDRKDSIYYLSEDSTIIQIRGLSTGNYEFFIASTLPQDDITNINTDNKSPRHRVQATIDEPLVVSYNLVNPIKHVSCNNGNDGSFSVEAKGGNGKYILHWKKTSQATYQSSTNLTISGLTAGEYEYYVVDENNCPIDEQSIQKVTIEQPQALVSTILDSQSPSGYGLSNGSIRVQIAGGKPLSNGYYTVVWKNLTAGIQLTSTSNEQENNQIISTLSNIPAGKYQAIITDANNCSTQSTIETVNQPAKLEVNVKPTGSILCYGDQTVDLTTTVTGGVLTAFNPVYSYQWYKIENGNTIALDITSKDLLNQGAGKYKVRVTDSSYPKNEVESSIIGISQPAALIGSLSKTNVSCYGANNGIITITAQGGSGSYTLYYKQVSEATYRSLTSSQKTLTINNLTNASYQLYLEDSNGCRGLIDQEKTKQITISQPNQALTLAGSTIVNVTGYGRSDGSISVQIEGGTPISGSIPYTIIWKDEKGSSLNPQNNKQTNGTYQSTITNLKKGTYTLQIQDANHQFNSPLTGCMITSQIQVTEPDPLIVTLAQTKDILCYGSASGELVANVKGGVPSPLDSSYTYKWYSLDSNNIATELSISQDQIQTNLPAGKYKVIIEDFSSQINTVASAIVEITQPTQLTAIVKSTNISCFGGNDGTIKVMSQGGTGSHTLYYKKREDTNYTAILATNTGIFTIESLTSGLYELYLEDANGCRAQIEGQEHITLELRQADKALTIASKTIQNPSGFGRNDGSIEITIDGGTPLTNGAPYILIWKSEDGTILTPENTQLSNGLYQSILPNLVKGSYTIEVRDANYKPNQNQAGCTLVSTINITEPDLLTVSLAQNKDILCYGETSAELIATVKGGVPSKQESAYHYKWYKVESNSTILLSESNTNTLPDLGIGQYKVIIEDFSSPINTVESEIIEISQPTLLKTQLTTRNISCFRGNDGFIHVAVSGGVGQYKLFYKLKGQLAYKEYPINSSNKTFELSNLTAGIYELYIQDQNLCFAQINNQDIVQIEITEPQSPLTITSYEIIDASGFGDSDAQITITIEGGTPNSEGSYNVVWKDQEGKQLLSDYTLTNGVYQSVLKNITAGQYSVEIKDANYLLSNQESQATCIENSHYVVTQPPKLIVEIEETHYISCNGMSDGELVAHAKGGIQNSNSTKSKPYKYQWYKKENGIFKTVVNQTDSTLRNIEAGIYKIEITDYSRIPHTVTQDFQLSEPDQLVIISEDVEITCGQTASISASIIGGTQPYDLEWSTGAKTTSLDDLYAGTYMLFVRDARGCETVKSFKVTTPSDLHIAGVSTNPICNQSSNGSITIQVTGGRAPYTYKWSNGSTQKDQTNLKAGFYTVIVTDKDGCSFSESFKLIEPNPLKLDLGEDKILCQGQSYTIIPEVDNIKLVYNWSGPNNYLSNESTITVNQAGVYRLTIQDEKGCQASDEMTIQLREHKVYSDIAVSTNYVYAQDTIAIVNITYPAADKIEWLISDKDPIEIIESNQDQIILVFKEEGSYRVGMRSFAGDCYQDVIKTLGVSDMKTGIEDEDNYESNKMIVYPNPNNGTFQVEIRIQEVTSGRLILYSLDRANVIDDQQLNDQNHYQINYNKALTPGIYILSLETKFGKQSSKVIVK